MTCGDCGNSSVTPPAEVRIRAAMCETCPRASRARTETSRWGAVACRPTGVPIAVHLVGGEPCPAGKLPGDDGVTRWAWIRWYGVPYPVRLWLWASHPRHPRPRSFAGCGCAKAAKDLWARRHRQPTSVQSTS